MKKLISFKYLLAIIFVIIVINLIFFTLHFFSLLIPAEIIKARILVGFRNENLVPENYPGEKFGWSANYTQIGLDQFTDCSLILMTLYRGESKIKNAIAPKRETPLSGTYCENLRSLAEGHANINDDGSYTLRYWVGSKVILSFLLQYLGFFEINNLIKILSYFSYFLIGHLIYSRKKQLFLPMFPIIVFGVFFSGINYHGGVAISLPYLVALWVIITLLLFHRFAKYETLYPFFFIITGSVSAFFYTMSGAPMLSLSMIFIVLYFIVLSQHKEFEKYQWISLYFAFFFIGFFSSIILKQLVSLLVFDWDMVMGSFLYHLKMRLQLPEYQGQTISAIEILNRVFGEFVLATYGTEFLRGIIINLSLFAWGGAIILGMIHFYRKGCLSVSWDLFALIIASLIVLARFVIFSGHTYIHGFFVSRFTFLPLAFGLTAFLIVLRHYIPSRRANFFSEPPQIQNVFCVLMKESTKEKIRKVFTLGSSTNRK